MHLLTFIAAFTVSFLGSLPVGVLNITVLRYGAKELPRQAAAFIVACMLVEAAYAAVALLFSGWLVSTGWGVWFEYLNVGVLSILGVYLLVKKGKVFTDNSPLNKTGYSENPTYSGSTSFFLGIGLSVANMMALPFWLVQSGFLAQQGWVLFSGSGILLFLAGVGLGGGVALLLFYVAGRRALSMPALSALSPERLAGGMLVASAVFYGIF